MTDDTDAAFQSELIAILPDMRAFARSLTRNRAEADDLAQEAMLKAWRFRSGFRLGTNIKAWSFMILRNQFYSEKRRSWRSQPLDQEVAERTIPGTDDPSGRLSVHDLRRAMLELPADQREALTLIGAAGLSYDQAAEVCGVPTGTIKSRVSRARAALLVILDHGDMGDSDVAIEDAAGAILRDGEMLRAAAVKRAA